MGELQSMVFDWMRTYWHPTQVYLRLEISEQHCKINRDARCRQNTAISCDCSIRLTSPGAWTSQTVTQSGNVRVVFTRATLSALRRRRVDSHSDVERNCHYTWVVRRTSQSDTSNCARRRWSFASANACWLASHWFSKSRFNRLISAALWRRSRKPLLGFAKSNFRCARFSVAVNCGL